jgi:hypothetical protein
MPEPGIGVLGYSAGLGGGLAGGAAATRGVGLRRAVRWLRGVARTTPVLGLVAVGETTIGGKVRPSPGASWAFAPGRHSSRYQDNTQQTSAHRPRPSAHFPQARPFKSESTRTASYRNICVLLSMNKSRAFGILSHSNREFFPIPGIAQIAFRVGTSASMTSPSGVEFMLMLPPSAAMRSRIPIVPSPDL